MIDTKQWIQNKQPLFTLQALTSSVLEQTYDTLLETGERHSSNYLMELKKYITRRLIQPFQEISTASLKKHSDSQKAKSKAKNDRRQKVQTEEFLEHWPQCSMTVFFQRWRKGLQQSS